MEYRNVFTMADEKARNKNMENEKITIRFGDIPLLYLSAIDGFSKEKFVAKIFFKRRGRKNAIKKWEESYIYRIINGFTIIGWPTFRDYYSKNNRMKNCEIFFYMGYWAKQRGDSKEKLIQVLDNQFKILGIHKPDWQDFTGKFYIPTIIWNREDFSEHDRSFVL